MDKKDKMWECLQKIKLILKEYNCKLVGIDGGDSVYIKDKRTQEIMRA